jgi:hypothetical protein
MKASCKQTDLSRQVYQRKGGILCIPANIKREGHPPKEFSSECTLSSKLWRLV